MTNMYKIISLSFLFSISLVTYKTYAQTFVPVNVTGFNHDVIAEGAGGMNRALTTTTLTFDDIAAGPGSDNVFYSKDFRGNTNLTSAPPDDTGLPIDGVIVSKKLIGAIYQLAPYNQNNALVLRNSINTGILTLETPGVFSKIAFLAASSNGSSTFNFNLNFSDNTSHTTSFTVPDWYWETDKYATEKIGRVLRTTDFFNYSTGGTQPGLFDNQIDIPPPFNEKILVSFTVTKTSPGTSSTGIFAINGITPANAPSAPVATAATNINGTNFTANWNPVPGATLYQLDISTSPTFSTLEPTFNNRDVGNVQSFNVTGLPDAPIYYYRVRARNAGGTSPSSNTSEVILRRCPPGSVIVSRQSQIDSFRILYPYCTKISGFLNIVDNNSINNVNGFEKIDTITDQLNIISNTALKNLDGFKNLKWIAGNFWISGNDSLTAIKSFDNLIRFGSTLYIGNNSLLAEISGFSKVSNFPLLYIENNPSLNKVDCFSSLDTINGGLVFKNNVKLTDIQSLGGVKVLNNSLSIESNVTLTNLTAFRLASFIRDIKITNNPALQHINDFSAVNNVDGKIEIQNNTSLHDITGLRNINPLSIKGEGLVIANNPALSVCNLSNFCTYLNGAGPRNISGNLGNCLNTQAVINACNAINAPEALPATNITASSFTANWTAVSGATGYFLDASTDPNFSTILINNFNAGNNLNTMLTGAAPNTTYYYRVRAANAVNTSPNSNVISVTTLNVIPTAPQALAATNITQTGFRANWSLITNATNYFIDVSTNANFTSFVPNYNNASTGNVQNFDVSGLNNNTTYYFRIRANNSAGTGPNSNVISVTTQNVIPTAPQALAATNITATGFRANWSQIASATNYFIDVSTNANFTSFVPNYNNASTGNIQNFDVSGLNNNTTYYFRIRANNSAGTGPNSNVISVTTLNVIPTAPQALAATNITQTGFRANWSLITNATNYFIDVATDANFTAIVTGYNSIQTGNVQSFIVSGLNSKTTYYYRIKANNSAGTGPNSNVIQLTTLENTSGPNPIMVTGFNEDIIADGAGSENQAIASTSTDMQNYVLYSKDFRGNNNPNSAPTYGLPSNGFISNETRPGVNFQLAPYAGKNALVLKSVNQSGMLALATPGVYSGITILAMSTGSITNLGISLQFSDGTNTVLNTEVPDWYNGSDFAIKGIGRMTRADDVFAADESAENPRLYNVVMALPPPFDSKTLTGITFTKTSETGNTVILGVNGTAAACNLNLVVAAEGDFCEGNDLALFSNIQGAAEYIWTGPGGSNLTGGATTVIQNANPDNSGRYSLEVVMTDNCRYSNFIDVVINPRPGIEVEEVGSPCGSDTIVLYESGGEAISWQWTGPAGFSSNLQNLILVAGQAQNGAYDLTVMGELGCTNTFEYELEFIDGEALDGNFLVSAAACTGDSIRIIDYSLFDEALSSISFSWNFGDGRTSSERDPVVVYGSSGSYTITLKVESADCSLTIQKNLDILDCRKTEILENTYTSVYPNPTQGTFNILISPDLKGSVGIVLYNEKGQKVITKEFHATDAKQESLSNVEPGIYFVQIIHELGIEMHRIIVIP